MDNWYGNIGGKLKGLAKAIFIIEAIAAILAGITLLAESSSHGGPIFLGLLVLVGGPLVAFVSSWLLYAIGELVERAVLAECNIRVMADIMVRQQNGVPNVRPAGFTPNAQPAGFTQNAQPAPNANTAVHKWRCDNCRNMRSRTPCEHCGAK